MIELPFEVEPLGGPQFCGEFWPLTPEQVETVEARIGWKLDPDYIDFLVEYGVCRPIIPLHFPNELGADVQVHSFFGAPVGRPLSMLTGTSDFSAGRTVTGIATADTGLIVVDEDNRVLFEASRTGEVLHLADNFREFVGGLAAVNRL